MLESASEPFFLFKVYSHIFDRILSIPFASASLAIIIGMLIPMAVMGAGVRKWVILRLGSREATLVGQVLVVSVTTATVIAVATASFAIYMLAVLPFHIFCMADASRLRAARLQPPPVKPDISFESGFGIGKDEET